MSTNIWILLLSMAFSEIGKILRQIDIQIGKQIGKYVDRYKGEQIDRQESIKIVGKYIDIRKVYRWLGKYIPYGPKKCL